MNISFYSGGVEPRLTFLYGSIMTPVENQTAHCVRTRPRLHWGAPASPDPGRQDFEPFCLISLAFIWCFWEGFNHEMLMIRDIFYTL